MGNEELIKLCIEKAQKWLTPAYDAETQAEVKRMIENEDKTDLIEAFYKDLEFGTGGLRGIMGVGSNRMNIYTVGAATQGLSNYLNKCFAGKKDIYAVNLSTRRLGSLLPARSVLIIDPNDAVSIGDIAIYYVSEKDAKILSIKEDEEGRLYGLRWNPDERIEIGNDDLKKIHKVVAIYL